MPEENLVQGSACLARPDHVDIDGREILFMRLEGRTQGLASPDLLTDIGEQ